MGAMSSKIGKRQVRAALHSLALDTSTRVVPSSPSHRRPSRRKPCRRRAIYRGPRASPRIEARGSVSTTRVRRHRERVAPRLNLPPDAAYARSLPSRTPRPKRARTQQKRGRFDPSGAVTSPAFRKKLEALPDDANAFVVGDASSPDEREDAAAAFKARALAFASLRSTAEEQTCLVGLIDALAALAAGERVVFAPSRKDTSGDGFSRKQKHSAPRPKPNKKVDQDLTRDPIEPAFSRCLDAFVEILFLPNTRPLHRAIVSAPRAFPPNARRVAERALSNALRVGIQTARSATNTERSGAARLRVLGVLFSVVSCQPQTAAERRVVRAVAVEAAALIGEGAERAHLFFFFFTPFGALLFSSLLKKGTRRRVSPRAFCRVSERVSQERRAGSSVMNSPFKSWNYHLKLERLGLWSPAL